MGFANLETVRQQGDTMKTIVMVVAMCALAGCVTAKPTIAPDGKQGFAVSCNGGLHNLGDCYQKAGEMCHGAYDVIAGDSSSGTVITGNRYGVYGGPIEKRTIIVECKS